MFSWVQRRGLQIAVLTIAMSAQVRAQTAVPGFALGSQHDSESEC